MRFLTLFVLTSFVLAACGDDHVEDEYATLQECFDDHTGGEGLSVEQAITVCTLEHPYGGSFLDFATVAECVAFVDANLSDASASATQIMAGCEDYIDQKGS